MENINLDVNAVLNSIISNRASSNPQARDQINDFLRLVLNRQTVTLTDVQSAVSAALQPLTSQLGEIMATLEQYNAALSRIDTATSTAASVLTEIRAKVAKLETDAGMSAQDEGSVLARLDGVATALEAMGKAPENPVPTPVPTPEPPTPTPEPTPEPAPEA